MIDEDLVIDANIYDYGASQTFEDILKWLLMHFRKAVELRRDDIDHKRPGAVPYTDTRLIWVKMLKRPESSIVKKVYSLTRKFNVTLENVIAPERLAHILDANIEPSAAYFNENGELNGQGCILYWRKIDAIIRDFDKGKTELKPAPAQGKTTQHGFRHFPSFELKKFNKFKWFPH